MHINLGMPHISHIFQKRTDKACKFIDNYLYYRKLGLSHGMAWAMAKNTL